MERPVLASLTRLMSYWSSASVQARVAREAGVDVEPSDIGALYALGMAGALQAKELAGRLRITRPTLSKQVARLEARGLVARRADPDDGRAVVILLTDSGVAAYESLVERGLEMVGEALRAVGSTDAHQFADGLCRFTAALGVDERPTNAATDLVDIGGGVAEIRFPLERRRT